MVEQKTEIKKHFKWTVKKAFAIMTIFVFLFSAFAFIAGTNMGVQYQAPISYSQGYTAGVTDTLVHVSELLQTQGVTLDWKVNQNGTYTLTVTGINGASASLNYALNLVVTVRNAQGQVISTARGAGTFTNLGKNFTIQQILYASSIAGFVSGGGTSGIPVTTGGSINSTAAELYLGDATTAASSVTSTDQPTETQSDGCGRAQETSAYYAAGAGSGTIGQFNVTVTKTCVTAGITINEWGLYYRPYSGSDASSLNSLVAYDSTPGSKNLAVGDSETETWTGTFS